MKLEDEYIVAADEVVVSKAEAKNVKKTDEKKKRGRPKGSKNQKKPAVVLHPELLRTQTGAPRQPSVVIKVDYNCTVLFHTLSGSLAK